MLRTFEVVRFAVFRTDRRRVVLNLWLAYVVEIDRRADIILDQIEHVPHNPWPPGVQKPRHFGRNVRRIGGEQRVDSVRLDTNQGVAEALTGTLAFQFGLFERKRQVLYPQSKAAAP